MSRRLSRHGPLFGTDVDVVVETPGLLARLGNLSAALVERRIVAELKRLEGVFNVFDPSSELSRLVARSEAYFDSAAETTPSFRAEVSEELADVLALSLEWYGLSEGLFNPLVGRAVAMWSNGATAGVEPSDKALLDAVRSMASMPFSIRGRTLAARSPLSGLNLNSLAKGWIVDRAVELGANTGARYAGAVYVNAGGDISRRGPGQLEVRIENPLRPYDNVEPLTTIALGDGGVASSGGSRRPVEIDGVRHNHLLDPATGAPATEVAGATVVADDAATADVVATVLGVSTLVDAVELLNGSLLVDRNVGAVVVAANGTRHANDLWRSREIGRAP